MPIIEDQELRGLFKAEAEEHLLALDKGLLHLEKNPADQDILEQVFRAMHSLKGGARMLGLDAVEALAHRCEDVLREGKSGDQPLTGAMIATLFPAVDALHKLVQEAVFGDAAKVELETIMGGIGKPAATKAKPATRASRARAAPAKRSRPKKRPSQDSPEDKAAAIAAAPRPEQSQFHIDTIRVGTDKLDKLMNQAGELTVSKGRITRRIHDIQAIADIWEEWSKAMGAARSLSNRAYSQPERREIDAARHLGDERIERLAELISALKQTFYEDVTRLEFVIDQITRDIRNIRLLPLSTIFNLYPRLVHDLAVSQSKKIEFSLEGGDTQADKHIIEKMKDPLMHLLRNAIDHAIEPPAERKKAGKPETGTIRLRASQTATNVCIEVIDDGRGISLEKIKQNVLKQRLRRQEELDMMTDEQMQSLIFLSGFSTSSFISDISGRGVGLDVVRANVEALKGNIEVLSEEGKGCTMRVNLPITLASARMLIIAIDGRSYAMPSESTLTCRYVTPDDIFQIEGRDTIKYENQPLHVSHLSDLLEIGQAGNGKKQDGRTKAADAAGKTPCVIIHSGNGRCGLLVDQLLDERPVVVKPIGNLLKRVRNVSNITILDTGEVCMILNPHDLVRAVDKQHIAASAAKALKPSQKRSCVLLVEDSITTRIQEKHILEGAGYEVIEAVDGVDALVKLAQKKADAVVTDIVMPNMDGLQLTEKIRQNAALKNLPVILVTTLATDEDKRRGLEAGANAYIMKPRFDQKVLLETLKRLI